ncbi:hypothetical protein WJX72_008738 [[Myrmecia] bisecta]|uniref:SHSP domain-containing protein n=1 Tax=[Myrmecia] bisecta TaxID=41462 RepID=A0AAW1R7I3_9CHLO
MMPVAYTRRTRSASQLADIDDQYVAFLDVEGLTREELRVELDMDSDTLVVKSNARVYRRFGLPEDVNFDGISAKLQGGELSIFLPKVPKPEPINIPIEDGDAPSASDAADGGAGDKPSAMEADAPATAPLLAAGDQDKADDWVDLAGSPGSNTPVVEHSQAQVAPEPLAAELERRLSKTAIRDQDN